MKKEYRIKKSSEIDLIFKHKKSKGNDFFVIYYLNSNEPHFRFGISIGKKFGNAVKRNKCKRWIREIININKNELKNMLFIVVVKKTAADVSFLEAKMKIEDLLVKSKIKNGENDEK